MFKCTELKPFKPCSESCEELGRAVLISLGSPFFTPFVDQGIVFDSLDENGIPNGLSAAITEAALRAVGLIADCDYRIVTSPYTPNPAVPNSGIFATDSQVSGGGFTSGYLTGAASWVAIPKRVVNGDFSIPFVDGVIRARIYTLAGTECPVKGPVTVGFLNGFALSADDLAEAPTGPVDYRNSNAIAVGPSAAEITAAFESGLINALLYFDGSVITNDEGENILSECTDSFVTTLPLYGLVFNKGHPCGTSYLLAFNEGLRRIVNNGLYAQIVAALAPEATPWTPETFPDLTRVNPFIDEPLKELLGNRLLYTGKCCKAKKHALKDNCEREERPLCDNKKLCPDCRKHNYKRRD